MPHNYQRKHWPFVLAALTLRDEETDVRVLLRSRTPEVAARFAPAVARTLGAVEVLALLDQSEDLTVQL